MKTPMPQPHPFAAAPASKGRARAVPKPAVTVYGYARVLTGGQSVDAQARQLRAASADKVFREVASGAKTDRTQLRRVIDQLDGDRRSQGWLVSDRRADITPAHGRLMLTC
jgi:hypothetical protein